MRRTWILAGVALLVTLGVLIALTTVLVPGNLSPAYAAAVDFTDAALERRDDAAATALLSPELAAWVGENCPDGVSECIHAYIPDEWGDFVDAVYRRSIPDGANAWDVQVIATFDERLTEGFSGVCIYLRAERAEAERWHITRWSGWVSCAEEDGLENLRSNPDAPNRAP
jgi:hypothetical protein